MTAESLNPLQRRSPYVEAVVTTSLRTGITEARMRRRKRYPSRETELEKDQKADIWWNERGKFFFHQSLKAWGNKESDLMREVGESTSLGSDSIDWAQSTEMFEKVLREAKKQRINPVKIAQRIKKYGSLLLAERAREARVLDKYYVEVLDLMDTVFQLTPSRRETIHALFRFQKTLPHL